MIPIATYRTERGRLALLFADSSRPTLLRNRGPGPDAFYGSARMGIALDDAARDAAGGCLALLGPKAAFTLRVFYRCGSDCDRQDDGRRPFGHWRRRPTGEV